MMGKARIQIAAQVRRRLSPQQQRTLDQRLRRLVRPAFLGTLRRTTPLSDHWGFERGTPIDRYYIDCFLAEHRADIRGRVLEVMDRSYTAVYGVGVTHSDVLDIDATNPQATVVADLSTADALPPAQFDCFILTQTLQFIYDPRAALTQSHRALRPHGVLLLTVPTVSRLDRHLVDYWRFTPAVCEAMFGEIFGREQSTVQPYGNVLASIGFLAGMAAEELSARELTTGDERFPVITAVRAVKR